MSNLTEILADMDTVSNEINLTLTDNEDTDSSKFGYIGYQLRILDDLIKDAKDLLANLSQKESTK